MHHEKCLYVQRLSQYFLDSRVMKIKASLGILALGASSLFAADSAWEQSFSLGLNVSKGNTDSTQVGASYDGLRKYTAAELQLKASANFGEENTNDTKNKTTDKYFAEAAFRRNLSKHYYWLLNASYTVDNIAQLDYRMHIGPGLGLRLIDAKKTMVDLEAGLAYAAEKYETAPKKDNLAYRVAEKWSYKLSQKSKLWQSAEVIGDTDKGGDYVIKGEIGVSSSIAGNLSLKSTVSDTYANQPAASKKKNDVTIMTMIVYSF